MISKHTLKDKNVLVLGYAVTGRSVASFLLEEGAKVTLNDYQAIPDDSFIEEFKQQGGHVIGGGHPLALLDEDFDFIVKNPGIPYQIPFLQEAIKRKLPIITDIELASKYWPGDLISVTGSNGKTTTVALIYEILKQLSSGHSYLAGNIGTPVLDYLKEAEEADHLVMEASSFQLQGTRDFHPHVAVITNLYSAHLDYHETLEAYHAAKFKSIANLNANDYIVYNYDQEEFYPVFKESVARCIPFSAKRLDAYIQEHGAYVKGDWVYFQGTPILPLEDIQLAGQHNVENVLAAVAVSMLYHVSPAMIKEVVKEYTGMPHRIQAISQYNGRAFYNDSKATNTVATKTALLAFKEPIRYIGGGLDRGNTFDDLLPYVKGIKGAYLYGESQGKMEESFQKAGIQPIKRFETLKEATLSAIQDSQEGEVILFSPACASWDQYKNFEIRGDEFMAIVKDYYKEEDPWRT